MDTLKQKAWSLSEKTFHQMFQNINNLRKSRQLCDVILKCEGREFYSHRIILSSCSDYFCAMFTNEMKEKGEHVIELQGLSAKTMSILLDFIYSEQFMFTIDNVQEILPAAALLQLNDILVGCEQFLKNQLDPHNCLGILKFAEIHDCKNLKNATQEYIYEHFSHIVQNSDEFLQLKPYELEELIRSNEIEVANEQVVYNCVIKWINGDKKEREKYLANILQHVRLPLLSPQFLTDVCDKEIMIKKSFECRDMLDDAKKFYLRPDCHAEMNDSRYKIRTGKNENLVMLGGFGFHQKPLDIVEKYCPRTNTWSQLPSLSKKRRYAASAAIGKFLYIIGGYDTKTRLKSVERLDLSEENPQWQSVSSLLFRRALPAICVHDNKIYVCGGFDGTTRHLTMEYYDQSIDKWNLLESTSVGREGAGLVALGDSLYCIGGYDGINLLKSVERYDLNTSSWSSISSMITPRSGAGCAALNYRIFVCGGFDGQIHLPTVETYSTITGQWTTICQLTISRCYCSATLLQGKIVVVGGYDGQTLLGSLEEYDEVKDKWTTKTNMPTARCDAGFAIIKYRNFS